MARQEYVLDGNRQFIFPFPVRDASDLRLQVSPGTAVPQEDYKVTGAGPASQGVTVQWSGAPTNPELILTIIRETPPDRVTDFPNNQAVSARALNAEFDNVYAALQDLLLELWGGEWEPETTFALNTVLAGPDGNIYRTPQLHTSSTDFNEDLSEGLWQLVAEFTVGQDAIDAALAAAEQARDDSQTAQGLSEDARDAAAASESAAATSATNAATSETNAAASEQAAFTSESNAASSEQNAAASETNAATSETNAAASEQAAAISESNAATSETNAAGSETNAATSETNAGNSADAAAASEAAAGDSETNAATSETNAAASLADFRSRYYGELASDPTTDPNGDPINAGDLYWNNASDTLRIYNGTTEAWQDAGASTAGLYQATATAGQTEFTITGGYTVGFVLVFLNGVRLSDADFTATDGSTVVLATGATAGDVFSALSFGTFDVANAYTKTETDAQIDLHAGEEGGVHGVPEGERALHSGEGVAVDADVWNFAQMPEVDGVSLSSLFLIETVRLTASGVAAVDLAFPSEFDALVIYVHRIGHEDAGNGRNFSARYLENGVENTGDYERIGISVHGGAFLSGPLDRMVLCNTTAGGGATDSRNVSGLIQATRAGAVRTTLGGASTDELNARINWFRRPVSTFNVDGFRLFFEGGENVNSCLISSFGVKS